MSIDAQQFREEIAPMPITTEAHARLTRGGDDPPSWDCIVRSLLAELAAASLFGLLAAACVVVWMLLTA